MKIKLVSAEERFPEVMALMEQVLVAEATREDLDLRDRMVEVPMVPVEALDQVATQEPVVALDPEPEVEVMDMVRVDMVVETKEQDTVMDLTKAGLGVLGLRQVQALEVVQDLRVKQVPVLNRELVEPRFLRALDRIKVVREVLNQEQVKELEEPKFPLVAD